MIRQLVLVLAMLSLMPAYARTLSVEGVVSPAWVERAGKREPLSVGMQLSDKDRIITGERARVMLRMSEGSAVKLGENATLALDGLAEKQNAEKRPLVSASLDVVKGAFRFTTGVFSKAPAERDVKVKIATVMDEPLQFFIAPRNEKPKPVGKVSQKQIDQWSLETEIVDGLGASRAGGRMRVELLRSSDDGAVRQLESKLRAEGFPVLVDTLSGSYGTSEYIAYIGGVANAKDREALMARVKAFLSGGADRPATK
jgi:hypothetical protein